MPPTPWVWTPERDAQLLNALGKQPLHKFARTHGVTIAAIIEHLRDAHGIRLHTHVRQVCARQGEMCEGQIVRELAISRRTFWHWCQNGLPYRSVPLYRRSVRVVKQFDLIAFVKAQHLLIDRNTDALGPSWRLLAAQINADWHIAYIARDALLKLLGLSIGGLAYLRRANGLPAPIVLGDNRPSYYERVAVRAWLQNHPSYQTAAAKKEFAL